VNPKNFYESFDQDTFFYSVSSIGETDHPLLKPFLPDSLFVLWDVSLSGLSFKSIIPEIQSFEFDFF